MIHANRKAVWPKVLPVLSPEQIAAKEGFMKGWHEKLQTSYQGIERFNHGWVAKLPHKWQDKTLEIGAGLGSHISYEKDDQDYYCLELRENFCDKIREKWKGVHVLCGDIQDRLEFYGKSFDRVIAIHVLEHLPRLPSAVLEIWRLLKHDGTLDVVIPTQGSIAYELASRISGRRYFEKMFKMDYTPIFKSEHCNEFPEIMEVLLRDFRIETYQYWPLRIPHWEVNLCAGFRLRPL